VIGKTLAKRYATALLRVTNHGGKVEETEATLIALRDVYRRDAKFRAVLKSPKITKAQKKSLLRKVLAAASAALHEFFDLLVDKNRTDLIPDIADMYDRLADAYKGVVRVQVRSAWPLAAAEQARLKGDLDRVTGFNCSIEATTDRALKGGVQVRIGDSVVDGTVSYRLKALKEKLQELQKR